MTLNGADVLVDACRLWRLERKWVRERKHKRLESGSTPESKKMQLKRKSYGIWNCHDTVLQGRPDFMLAIMILRRREHQVA